MAPSGGVRLPLRWRGGLAFSVGVAPLTEPTTSTVRARRISSGFRDSMLASPARLVVPAMALPDWLATSTVNAANRHGSTFGDRWRPHRQLAQPLHQLRFYRTLRSSGDRFIIAARSSVFDATLTFSASGRATSRGSVAGQGNRQRNRSRSSGHRRSPVLGPAGLGSPSAPDRGEEARSAHDRVVVGDGGSFGDQRLRKRSLPQPTPRQVNGRETRVAGHGHRRCAQRGSGSLGDARVKRIDATRPIPS